MKIIFWMTILLCYSFSVTAQNWEQLGKGTNDAVREIFADTLDSLLYIGGNFKYIGNPYISEDTLAVNGITKWTKTEYLPLATGQDYCINVCDPILSIFRFQDEIYCNASVKSFSGVEVKGIAKWNGSNWHPVGEGLSDSFGGNGNTYSQIIYQEDLVVGGGFTRVGTDTVYGIARWDGVNWHSMNFPAVPSFFPFISAMAIYNDELYVAGNFQALINGGVTSDVAKFDGTQWHEVGGGLKGGWSFAEDLIMFKNELYLCGYFWKSDGNAGNMIMKLQNDQWADVAGGVSNQLHDMVIFNDELYVAGGFEYAGDGVPANNIAKWTGEKWCGLGSVFDNRILCVEVFNNDLYIGGGFTLIDGDTVNYIAKWIGGDYVDTCGMPVATLSQPERPTALSLSPNPTHNQLQLVFDLDGSNRAAKIRVLDVLGKELEVNTFGHPGDSFVTLDLRELPAGVYFITVQGGNVLLSQKVIKQ